MSCIYYIKDIVMVQTFVFFKTLSHQLKKTTTVLHKSLGKEQRAMNDTPCSTCASPSSSDKIGFRKGRLFLLAISLKMFSAFSLLPLTTSHRVDSGTQLTKYYI